MTTINEDGTIQCTTSRGKVCTIDTRGHGLAFSAPPSLASSAALAFRDHDATLRALAEQEQEDAVLDVAQLYEQHLRARLRLEEALRAGATTEAEALAFHEARLSSDRTHRAWEQAEHDLLGAARYGEAWPERRAKYLCDGVGPHAPPLEPPVDRDLEPICEGDATLYEYGGPFDCPGCSACVPLDGKVDT